MTLGTFWQAVDDFLAQAAHTDSAPGLIALANTYWDPSSGDAFFAGSGGDGQLIDVLGLANGWTLNTTHADYWFTATAADGTRIEYVEGDIYQR